MNRFKLIAAAIVAGIATQASAEPFSFHEDGQLYVGERTQKGDQIVLTGINKSTADRFNLTVSKGWVNGTVGGRAVRFHVQDAKTF